MNDLQQQRKFGGSCGHDPAGSSPVSRHDSRSSNLLTIKEAYDHAVSIHDQPISPLRPPDRGASHRLGYLLKHAELRYARLTSAELEPLGTSPREWAALNCLDEQPGRSQREVADLLGVDRTTMVALVDELQAKGWVRRRPQHDDRRKNTVGLTKKGRDVRQRGARLIDDCERRFLAVLSESDAAQLKNALAAVIAIDQ
jgi:DNA-binding MarR family transcriptional regulator